MGNESSKAEADQLGASSRSSSASLPQKIPALIQENQFYQAQMSGMPSKAAVEQATAQLSSRQISLLTKAELP